MKIVWKKGEATVHDVRGVLNKHRNLAYTTILTTLRNLERKGYLNHKQGGRSHIYLPKLDEETVARRTVLHLMENFFDGSPARLANALFEEENLSKKEFEKLRKKILELRKKEGPHG